MVLEEYHQEEDSIKSICATDAGHKLYHEKLDDLKKLKA